MLLLLSTERPGIIDQRELFEIYYKSKLEKKKKKGKKNLQHLTEAEVAAGMIGRQCSSNGV